MAVYKPIRIRTATYSGGSRTPSVSGSSEFQFSSPSAKTGSGGASTSLVPYSSPSKALVATTPTPQKSGVGVVGRTVATFGDVVANVLEGAFKSLEGIYDVGATAVGAVGGIFSDEFRKAVQKHVQYDFVGEHIGDPLQQLTKDSYLNELRIGKYSVGEAAELVAQGVGGMLPSVALALMTGGSSLAAQIAGTGSMMAGAAGNATEEAFAGGASYGSGAAYGLVRGAIEGATEYLGGVTLGGGTSLAGKALAGTTLGKAAQKGVGRVAYNFISEGAEEVLSDLTDPMAKYLTGVDKNVGENYKETFKGLPKTFLVGGSVGTLMGGAQDFVRSKSKGQAERGGAAATRADYSLRNVIEMNENGDTGAGAEKYAAAKMSSYQMMSYELRRMSNEHRAKYLDSIGVHKLAFDDKGQLVAKAAESVNNEAVTPTLRALSGNLKHAPIAEGVQISESAATAKETVLKALGSRANVAITDAIEGDNALYNPDEDVIYISNGVLDGSDFNNEDIARAVALHEVAHKAEGTQAYLDMVDEVQKIVADENAPADVKMLVGDRVQRRKELIKSYWDKDLSREQNRYVVDTELISNMLGDLLGNSNFVERMAKRQSSAWERFVMAMKAADAGKAAGISKEAQKYLSGLYKAYVKAVDDAGGGVKVSSIVDEEEKEKAADAEKGVDSEKNERKSKLAQQIRPGMDEHERAQILKNAYITPARFEGDEKSLTGKDVLILKSTYTSKAAEVLRDLGEKFSIFDKTFDNENISLDFLYSRRSLGESVHKQSKLDEDLKLSDFYNFAKMLSVFDEVIRNAIPIEIHTDKYVKTRRENKRLRYDYVLLSAMQDGSTIIPVEFHIKEFLPSPKEKNRLYVSVTLGETKIEDEVKVQRDEASKEESTGNTNSSSVISIPRLIEKVNPKYGNFFKYIPSEMLSEEQLASKKIAVKDEEYRLKVMRGEDVSELLRGAAEESGYSFDESWKMDHRAPNAEYGLSMAEIDKAYGGDGSIYSPRAVYYYGEGRDYDQKAINVIRSARNNPEKEIRYYRAVPKNVKESRARNGDWVAIVKEYAIEHGERVLDGDYRIIEGVTLAKNLYSNGDSINEWGFDNGNHAEVYQNTENNVKTLEVTYDDRGELIPLSKRFNQKTKDERYSKKKTYRRAEASAVLEEAVGEHLVFSDAYAKLKGQSKREAASMLWKALNTAEGDEAQKRAALNVADYVLDHAVVAAFEGNAYTDTQAKTVAALKPYLHKLDLDGIKGEIRNRFGKDTSPYLLWGKHKDSVGVAPDAIVAELAELGVIIDAKNPADIFFEIYDAYKKAKDGLEASAASLLKHALSAEERSELREQISSDILRAYEEKGVETLNFNQFYKELEKAQQSAEVWKARYYEEIDRNYIANRLLEKVRHLDELKKGAFLNATQSKTFVEKFKGSIFRLSRIRFRGNLNRRGTRKIFAALSEWYNDKENLIVRGTEGIYNESIAAALESIAKNEKPLSESENAIVDALMARFKTSDIGKLYKSYTVENLGREYDEGVKHLLRELSSEVVFTSQELKTIEAVVDYFTHFVKNYNKVWRAGKYVDAPTLAKGYIESLRKRSHSEPSVLRKWFEAYYQSFGDPMALARYMDRYDKHGFFTESLEELRRAALEAAVLEMQIREPLEKFYKEHKRFLGDLRSKNVKVWDGTEIPLAKAISLYMTLHREQAVLGLARSGFAMKLSEDSKEVRFQGFAPMEEIDDAALASAAKEAREALYQQFTDEEKQFIKIAEKIFGEDCKNAKHETDMIRMGFSNTIEGYYFPIARAYISHSIDSNVSFTEEMNRVSSASFNKDTVTGAKGELFINDVDLILDRHVRGVTQYAKLSLVVDEFNVLYSLDVGENANKATSVMTESKNAWRGNEEYFRKLISDVQGIPASKRETIIDEWLPRIRSGYAKFQLGANPKTCLTQLSSLAASSSLLDADSILRGLSMSAKDVDEYCVLAKLRNTDNAAALAQGLIEKTSSLGDFLMKPIGLMDRLVITRLFAACQVQISKNGGPALESKENKERAGELLERVIFETQQNSLATEKSQAMRSGNEFTKALTMFSADGMKVFGRVVDGIGECLTLKELLKAEKEPSEIESLKKQLRRANKKARRAVGALLSSAVLMALLARLVNKFLGRDEEDGAEAFIGDMAGNLVGGLPLIRDVATFAFDGYEINNYAYSAMNDMLKGAAGLYNIGAAALSGEWDSRETARTIRKAFYAAGTVLGVPARNVYNYTYGIINSISGEAGYKMEDLFYKQSYRADLAKAIEKGDDGMVATIAGLMLDEGVGGMTDKALREAMRDLIAAGHDVVPRGVPDRVTLEGEVYELKAKQKRAFEATYSQAHVAAAKLVKRKDFASASDAVKAKALGFVYDLYYDTALCELVGDGSLGKSALFATAIDASALALAISTAKSFESDKDKDGKAVPGSLKKKIYDYVSSLNLKAVQKYMIMGYLGYKNTLGKDQVNAYIQTLKLSAEQKKELLAESGY
jgi:hypothetical protein